MRPIRFFAANFRDPAVVEAWASEPNEGLNGPLLGVVAGNTLGGSSAINGRQFSRPEAKVPPRLYAIASHTSFCFHAHCPVSAISQLLRHQS